MALLLVQAHSATVRLPVHLARPRPVCQALQIALVRRPPLLLALLGLDNAAKLLCGAVAPCLLRGFGARRERLRSLAWVRAQGRQRPHAALAS
eukprot:CAMPEP_0202038800 /NCGR_PEP_ID=MMETSP0962-20130828/12322_1 /ASSEMBLY_ACC=CAM_ASM_000488 /TAXON_ID=4773 /ORGANISM="Schizochytrium aggregatum, Strain ATCC28209" /LENGTH=92 /DNA_ID=CAMNT_0048602985 /DNA_START=493 /DNA_END=767 /DNA_ORIENTATION=-